MTAARHEQGSNAAGSDLVQRNLRQHAFEYPIHNIVTQKHITRMVMFVLSQFLHGIQARFLTKQKWLLSEKAAEHHEHAAKHAKSGSHEKAAHHSKIAHGHSLHAVEHHVHASKKHADNHG